MSNGNQVKAAIVLWNGGETDALKELVDALAAWYSGTQVAAQPAEEPEPEEPDPEEQDPDDPDPEDGDDAEPEEQEDDARRSRRRVTGEEISDWVRRADDGESISEIARSAGRSISTVHEYVREARNARS